MYLWYIRERPLFNICLLHQVAWGSVIAGERWLDRPTTISHRIARTEYLMPAPPDVTLYFEQGCL